MHNLEKRLSVEALLDAVDRLLEEGLPEGTAPVAAFDADGTLWSGDIGETAFCAGFRAGLVSPKTVMGPIAEWAKRWGLSLPSDPAQAFAELAALCEKERILERGLPEGLSFDEARADLYAMQAWAFAGRRDEELIAFAKALFEEGFSQTIFPWAKALVEALRARGVEALVVSASPQPFVVPGARRVLIEAPLVFGTVAARGPDGRYLAAPDRCLYGDEKARLVEEELERRGAKRPLLAFGDSVAATDRALLRMAFLPVAVFPKGRHLEAAMASERIRLLAPAE